MIELIVRHLLVLALAGFLALLLRRRSAALRHALWAVALILCIALPLLQKVPIGLPPTLVLPTLSFGQPVQPLDEIVAEHSATSAPLVSNSPLPTLQSLAWGFYLIVTTALAARWAGGWWMAVRLARRGKPLGRFHDTRVVVVPNVGPLTFSWPRATIVVPDASFRDRELVLRHELAHVQRADFIWQALGALACALWWFSPAVWLANRALRSEADRACDDRVLTQGASAPDYADSLLEIASMKSSARRPATALVPLIRRAGLAPRISSILASGTDRGSAGLLAILAMAALLLPAGLFVSHGAMAAADVAEIPSQDIRPTQDTSSGPAPSWTSLFGGVKLPPIISLQGKRIMLDPGHGGSDPGAIRDGLREADRTLDIARRTADYLRRQGAIVTMTRDGDQYVTQEQRAALSAGQDFFLSIHLEARPSVADAPGSQFPLSVFFHSEADAAEEAVAKDIASSIDFARGAASNGKFLPPEIRRVNLTVLRDANCPAYMINLGDIDKAGDRFRSSLPAIMAGFARGLMSAAASRAAD